MCQQCGDWEGVLAATEQHPEPTGQGPALRIMMCDMLQSTGMQLKQHVR